MNKSRFMGAAVVAVSLAGCAGNTASVPDKTATAPTASSPRSVPNGLPERVESVPTETRQTRAAPQSIDLGPYDRPAPVQQIATVPQSVNVGQYDAPQYVAQTQPTYTMQSPGYTQAQPLRRGQMSPVRDDPVLVGQSPTRASTYNIASRKANYVAADSVGSSAPPPRVRNAFTPAFGRELSQSALSRINPRVQYVAAYKKIGYPWGDVPESTGVCTDVVIRSYRGLGIDLQSMVHQDMRRAFSAYPSQRIYGLTKADPNIDHRRVVNLEAFFERVGARITLGSATQPGDVITWRLSGGEPHIGVVVDRKDIKTGNYMIVHNLGAGVQVEDLLEYAPAHGHYRFAPDQQSRMASMALRRG